MNKAGVIFQVQWHPILSGLVIQFLLGLITIRWSVGRNIFQCIGDRVTIFLGYSNEGAMFVYGRDLIDKGVFAFQVSIFFFSIYKISSSHRSVPIWYITIRISRGLIL
jgi:pyrimidine nucleoside transport protein